MGAICLLMQVDSPTQEKWQINSGLTHGEARDTTFSFSTEKDREQVRCLLMRHSPKTNGNQRRTYDYAKGSFDDFPGLEGKLKHTRHLYYSRSNFWIVVDEIETDRPRRIDVLWHWHPKCKVAVDGNSVYTENDRGNLQIVPITGQEWEITFIEGQEEPEIQGWYSKEYNEFEPNVASIYTTQIKSDSKVVWLLFPSEKVEKGTKATIITELPNAIKGSGNK